MKSTLKQHILDLSELKILIEYLLCTTKSTKSHKKLSMQIKFITNGSLDLV